MEHQLTLGGGKRVPPEVDHFEGGRHECCGRHRCGGLQTRRGRLSVRRARGREESSPLRGHAARVPGARRLARAAGRGGEGGAGVERALLVAAGQSPAPPRSTSGGGQPAGGQILRQEPAAAFQVRPGRRAHTGGVGDARATRPESRCWVPRCARQRGSVCAWCATRPMSASVCCGW